MEHTDKRQVTPQTVDSLSHSGRMKTTSSSRNGSAQHFMTTEFDSNQHHLHIPNIPKIHHGYWTESDGHDSPLTYFVTPLFTFLRLIFMTHSKFEFNVKEQSFRHVPGSIFRKVICIIVQIILTIHLWGQEKYIEGFLGGKNIIGLFKIMSVFYVALMIAFFHVLMTKGNQLNDVLNFMQKMTLSVAMVGCKIPRKLLVRSFSIGVLILYILYTVFYAVVNADEAHGMTLVEGLEPFLISSADQGARRMMILMTSWNISQLQEYKFSNNLQHGNKALVIIIGIVQMILNTLVALSWTMAFLMITMWGFLFWKILNEFFILITHTTVRNTLEDIRKFNTITRIINKFNGAFGFTILTGAATGVLHFSVNIIDLFKDSQPWTQKLSVAFGLLAFGILLLTSAQVNQTAARIIQVIKDRYQDEAVWHDFHGDCIETTQGMLLVVHEIQNNSIGFSGVGFFTITYSFIGTVLSVISSYSIVVIQFQIQN